jgi:hypothetical protein
VKRGSVPDETRTVLPNFRDKVIVSEILDLAHLAEELYFDPVWTLDRIVVPEARPTVRSCANPSASLFITCGPTVIDLYSY